MSHLTPRSPTIIILSPTPWDFPVKQIQYFAKALSRHFHTTYLNTNALTFRIHPSTLIGSFLTSPTPLTLEPHLPPPLTLPKPITNYLTTKSLGKPPFIFWTFTSQIPLFLKTTQFPIVYDFIDRTFDLPNQAHEQQLRHDERWLLKHSKIIVTATSHYQELAKKLHPASSSKLVTFPIGFNLKSFLDQNPSSSKKKRPRILYLGGISPRLEFGLIQKIVTHHPDVFFTFIGPVYPDKVSSWLTSSTSSSTQSFVSQLKKLRNVAFVPALNDPVKLAQLAVQADIGWIPYDPKIPYNRHCTPVKFMEYLALGLPILSTPLRTISDFKRFYIPFTNVKQFHSALQESLNHNSPALISSRKKQAIAHSLPEKINQARKLIDSLI